MYIDRERDVYVLCMTITHICIYIYISQVYIYVCIANAVTIAVGCVALCISLYLCGQSNMVVAITSCHHSEHANGMQSENQGTS